jgi:hypothetical protein
VFGFSIFAPWMLFKWSLSFCPSRLTNAPEALLVSKVMAAMTRDTVKLSLFEYIDEKQVERVFDGPGMVHNSSFL